MTVFSVWSRGLHGISRVCSAAEPRILPDFGGSRKDPVLRCAAHGLSDDGGPKQICPPGKFDHVHVSRLNDGVAGRRCESVWPQVAAAVENAELRCRRIGLSNVFAGSRPPARTLHEVFAQGTFRNPDRQEDVQPRAWRLDAGSARWADRIPLRLSRRIEPCLLMARSPSIFGRPCPSVGSAAPMPALVEPMLAAASALPSDLDNYSFEWKWDGVRAMCYYNGKRAEGPPLTLRSRNQIDTTSRYPELQVLPAALRCRQAILDGEIVAMDDPGRPSFELLQRRMHINDPPPTLRRAVPVLYVLFDIVYRDGKSLLDRPFRERRKCLEAVATDGPYWQITSSHGGDVGAAMLEAARQNGLEGVVAKRLDSRYEPGRRSGAWLKVKVTQRQEFVVGGWVPEEGGRGDRVGSMLLGYYDAGGNLRYAGRVGTGLNDSDHAMLLPLLRRMHSGQNPFVDKVPGTNVNFLTPALVVEVEFKRWSNGGRVQHAAFKGVRSDKEPRLVVKERTSQD